MSFQTRHQNRTEFPDKHVLVCEDDLDNQVLIAVHMRKRFSPQGKVQFSFVSGAMAAAGVISWCKVDVILLDHDMPHGNGADLMEWLRNNKKSIPVITFSGILANNDALQSLGADHKYSKQDVLSGRADDIIRSVLKM